MPRPKQMNTVPNPLQGESDLSFEHEEGISQGRGIDEMVAVIKFVARTIRTINVNGKSMTGKCRLCSQARILREPCQHDRIWKLAGM